MADISALYPQPQAAAQPGLLTGADPTRVLGALGQVNQLARFQKEFQAKQAIGEAYSSALNADGSVDLNKVATTLRGNPNASFLMPEATSTLLDQHGKQITNDTASFQQWGAQNDYAKASVAGLLQNPKLTPEIIHNWATALSRNADHRALPSSVISSVQDYILQHPQGIRAGVADIANGVMGPAASAGRVTVPPGPGGVPQSGALGGLGYVVPGAMPTGQAPGEETVQGAASARAANIQASGDTTAQYHADLENLKQLSKTLEIGGPTVDLEKKLNQLSSRFGFTATMTPDQLKSVEEFDKIANQVSLNQSKLFHGSDAGLHTVVGANPSSSMSRYGREGVIDMLQGNQDAIDTTRRAWLDARAKGAPANSYDMFINEFSKVMDPRVFQFNRMSRDNQQKFLETIDREDLGDFEQRYKEAMTRKWVKPPKSAPK